MDRLVLVGILLLLAACLAWRDPRRLSIGVIGLAAVLVALEALGNRLTPVRDPGLHPVDASMSFGVLVAGVTTVPFLAAWLIAHGVVMARRAGPRQVPILSLGLGVVIVAYMGLTAAALLLDWRSLAVGMMLAGFPVIYLAFGFTAFVGYGWIYGAIAPQRVGAPQAIVVLGAGLRGDRVTPLLASRLRRALDVYWQEQRAGRPVLLVTSGGQGPGETTPEAVAMSAWLRGEGVPPGRIVEEGQSTTTDENIAFSLALLRARGVAQPYVVVTNNFHAFRAAMLMRRHGMAGQAIGSPTAGYFVSGATMREFLAVLRDFRWLNGVLLLASVVPVLVWLTRAILP